MNLRSLGCVGWLNRAVLALLLACLSVSAQAAEETAQPFSGLKSLPAILQAGGESRQPGQPGNEAVDQWVAQRFAELVQQANASRSQDAAEAQQKRAEAEATQRELLDAMEAGEIASQAAAANASPAYIRYTLEDPWPLAITAFLSAAALVLTWWMQRRQSLLIVAGAFVVVGVATILAALNVTTEFERNRTQPTATDPGAKPRGNVHEVARKLLDLDLAAAEAARGLWQTGRIHFPSAVFVPGRFELLTADQRTITLHALAPNVVDPGNLRDGKLTGPLVYLGRGELERLRSVNLNGAIAVMEFASGRRWLDAVEQGVVAVIFVEPVDGAMEASEAIQKLAESPLSLPRYFVRRSDFAAFAPQWLSNGQALGPVTLKQLQPSKWESRNLAIDWLFIPGTAEPKPAGAALAEDPARQLVHLQASKDSASIVPALAPGVSGAVNLAMLMELAEQFRTQPPLRPVLLSAVNDRINGHRGEQEFASVAFAETSVLAKELEWITRELAKQRFIENLYGQTLDQAMIDRLRDESTMVGGQVFKSKTPIIELLSFQRNIHRRDRDLAEFQRIKLRREEVAGIKVDPAEVEKYELKRETARREADRLVNLMSLFNRFGARTLFADLSEENRRDLQAMFAQVRRQAGIEAARIAEQRDQMLNNLALRRRLLFLAARPSAAPSDARVDEVFLLRHPVLNASLMVCLELSLGTSDLGFFHSGFLASESESRTYGERVGRLAQHTLRVASELSTASNTPNLLTDTIRNARGIPWAGHLGGRFAIAAQVPQPFLVPALSLTNVRDDRRWTFTPSETPQRIDAQFAQPAIHFAMNYLPALISSQELGLTMRLGGRTDSFAAQVSVRKLDKLSNTTQGLPAPNVLVFPHPGRQELTPLGPMLGDVRPSPVALTDVRGTAIVRGALNRGGGLQAFGYDSEYSQLVSALDFNQGERRFSSSLAILRQTVFATRTAMVFPARKVDMVGLTEPLALSPVTTVEVLDARQDSMPRNFGVAGVLAKGTNKTLPLARDGTASLMIDPDTFFKLRVGQGIIINLDPERPDEARGRGFSADVGMLRALPLQTASDMVNLTSSRLVKLGRSGVTNKTADEFTRAANARIEAIKTTGGGTPAAEEARGLAYRGYASALGTTNDLIKAVVIFLALVIPFCFFLTKLMSPYDDIGKQLTIFAGVFVLMALLLRMVHPAFSIAETPMVVLLAFVMMGLAIFVAVILMSRFNSSMNQVVEQAQMAESADAPQGRLAGVAFVVGVNNMKRRRIRTTLTCVTIVLVTFTMLSVISVGQGLEPARLRTDVESPYDGLFYARPGLAPIVPVQFERLRGHFSDKATTVARVWAQRQGEFGEYLPFLITVAADGADQVAAKVLESKVLLGLEQAEQGFVGPLPLTPGSRWFSSNSAMEIVLSIEGAALLGITPENFQGKEVQLLGRPFKVVGLMEDEPFAAMKDLSGVPLLPVLTEAKQDAKAAAAAIKQAEAEAAGVAALEAGADMLGTGTMVAIPRDVAMLPMTVARQMAAGDYRTLSVKYSSPDTGDPSAGAVQAWTKANELIRYQHARVTVGLTKPVTIGKDAKPLDAGQFALASSSSTEVGGVLKIAVPIMLAATIILNTMLGSVMERKREVAIYNAIGLNPTHVMVFFLAESLVFGLVGSVAGYLIGQTLSLVLTRLNVPLNLNYSSLSVMVVIFLTIATVLISTIYPALMAARAAVPSGQRRWSLPQPVGDEIHVQFPFSYDASRVLGVCAYLYDFMQQNTEASTGTFLAKIRAIGRVNAPGSGSSAGKAYAMVFDVAPAPFDLGVNQKMEVYAYYDTKVRAHMLSVHLRRVSGERGNWLAVNQPFLEALRKRLLGWRSQRGQVQQSYFEQGERMFAAAEDLSSRGAERVEQGVAV